MTPTTRKFRPNPKLVGMYTDSSRVGVGIAMSNGEHFVLLEPDPRKIDPEVIAHSLANLCRFTGHTMKFYSVAQHCIMVSQVVPPELALQGLLHDASEAFIGDVSKPLKVVFDHLAPGVLTDIEEQIHEAIAERFGTDFPHDPAIKVADNIALATEARDLVPASRYWKGMPDPLPRPIQAMGPRAAKNAWLKCFRELGGE